MRALTIAAMLLSSPALAGELQDVSFEATDAELVFTFTGDGPIAADAAEASLASKGKVLVIAVAGLSVKQRWLKTPDAMLKRTLVKPGKGRIILRTRFKKKIAAGTLEKISFDSKGNTLVARVPKDPSAAPAVVAAPVAAPVVAIAPVAAPPLPGTGTDKPEKPAEPPKEAAPPPAAPAKN
ncbi:MAG: hypothetical protein GY913_15850, partial [Proteobacteria bacterium]|nr:hypothetical protein [Pseudomonadota bacterium]